MLRPAELDLGAVNLRAMERTSDYQPIDISTPKDIIGGVNLSEELTELIQHCQTLNKKGQYQALFECLEHFLMHLPFPTNTINEPLLPFYQAIQDPATAATFFNQISQLQTLYTKSIHHCLGQHTDLPRIYLAKLSLFTVIGHVAAHAGISTKSYNQILQPLVNNLTSLNQNAVYLACHEPVFDNRYQAIRRLYSQQNWQDSEIVKRIVPYYQTMIDTKPTLKEALECLYLQQYGKERTVWHEKIEEQGYQALYYLTEHLDELRRDPQYQTLVAQFDAQQQLEQCYNALFDYTVKETAPYFKLEAHLISGQPSAGTPLEYLRLRELSVNGSVV